MLHRSRGCCFAAKLRLGSGSIFDPDQIFCAGRDATQGLEQNAWVGGLVNRLNLGIKYGVLRALKASTRPGNRAMRSTTQPHCGK